jgi:CDP-diacylglycerol pyrophosphatase
VFDMLGRTLPRDAIGLAVNSVQSRTQDQLHIHVDCVSPAVRQAIAAKGSLIGTNWRPFPTEIGDQIYWAKVVSSADLSHVNVAVLMRQGLPRTGRAMGRFTVAAIGTTMPDGKDGFFLFANSANAAAESLLDHSCRGV